METRQETYSIEMPVINQQAFGVRNSDHVVWPTTHSNLSAIIRWTLRNGVG